MNGLSMMVKEYWHKHHVKARFLLVGAWNSVFGYAMFCLIDTWFTHLFSSRTAAYMYGMVVAQILAVISAFVCHKYITFRSAVRGLAVIAEFFRFTTTYIFTFVLSLLLMPLLVRIGHIPPKLSALIILGICTVISYLGHARFSFRTQNV